VETALNQSAIKTKRLVLRRFKAEDAVALHPIFADPEAMRFWSSPPKSLAQTEEFVRDTIRAYEAGTGDDFVVLYEGVVIGKAGLWRANEIGFIFSRSVWGRGIASEAVRAIMSRASTRGITSVIADVDPRNERCLWLLEKLGFVQTGAAKRTVLVGDVWADSVYLEAKV
jgi:[ribosomal protein S5]-alanine N-acetyltransferase